METNASPVPSASSLIAYESSNERACFFFHINSSHHVLYRPAPRVDRRGDIFFRSPPCPSGFAVSVLGSGFILSALAASSFRGVGSGVFFFFRPTPSRQLFSVCLLELSPAPGAWDVRTGDRFAAAGGTAVLLASCRIVPLSHCVRSLSSCLLFGSSSRVSSLPAYRVGSCSPVVGSRPLFAPCPLAPCVSCFVLVSRPRLICLVRSARRSLPVCPRLGDSVAVPCHPIGAVACFAPSASAFRFSSPLRLVLSPLGSYRVPSRCAPLCRASPFPAPPRRHSCFALSRYRAVVSVLSPCCPRGGLALVRFSCRSCLVPPISPPCLS